MPHPVAPAIVRRRGISLALVFFLWAAVLQFVVKLLLAQTANSLGLLACAFHTLLLCFSALLSLQSLRQPKDSSMSKQAQPHLSAAAGRKGKWRRSGTPAVDISRGGRLETLTALLMWALLGFGGFSLLGQVWHRSWEGRAELPLGGEQLLPPAVAETGAAMTTAPNLHPGLLPLLGVLAILGFCLAFFAHVSARQFSSQKLAFQGYLLLQDGWLLLLAVIGILAVGQGLAVLELVAAVSILLLVLGDAYRWLDVHVPHWWGHLAIAPEAIIATAQQVDGVLGCQVLHCRGLVGRGLTLSLELRLHPEFESLRHQLGRQVCRKLENRYGPTQAAIYLVSQGGGARRRLNLSQDDEISRIDSNET